MSGVGRRKVLTGAGALALGSTLAFAQSTLEESGFAPDLGERLDAGIRSGLLRNVHAVVITRAGKLVLERYYEGPDEAWGRRLGHVKFNAETLHDLRSVTKSVVSLLYGIALDRGLVPPPEAPLYAQFPEYPDLAGDPARAGIRIEHVLTMSAGLDWNETRVPYTNPANHEVAMENAPDRYRFVLGRPVAGAPGERWTYSGGLTALLGRLIEQGTGLTLAEFAREALFEPLGMTTVEWARGSDGAYSAASGLRLLPRDLARIGELLLNNGRWAERQVVSEAWLAASMRPAIAAEDGFRYGHQWFLSEEVVRATGGRQRWIAGFGNGGQRLWIMPAVGLSVAILAGNYNAPDAWIFPLRIWREIVLPNLQKA